MDLAHEKALPSVGNLHSSEDKVAKVLQEPRRSNSETKIVQHELSQILIYISASWCVIIISVVFLQALGIFIASNSRRRPSEFSYATWGVIWADFCKHKLSDDHAASGWSPCNSSERYSKTSLCWCYHRDRSAAPGFRAYRFYYWHIYFSISCYVISSHRTIYHVLSCLVSTKG